MRPREIANVISKEVKARLDEQFGKQYYRGVVAVVNGNKCDVNLEGALSPITDIPCLAPYAPAVGARVLVLSMGQSGANFIVLGGTTGGIHAAKKGIVPTGTVDGTNATFTAPDNFVTGSLQVYKNGIRVKGGGDDYTESGTSFTFVTPPATGTRILVDYNMASDEVYGGTSSIVTGEDAVGTLDGSNTVFTVPSGKYAAGSLAVMVNGLRQDRVTHFTESDPDNGEFTMDEAPAASESLTVDYHEVHAATGNADMLDGKHASEFMLLNAIQTFTNKTIISEDWHNVGDAGEPAFQNSWVNYDSTSHENCAFFKDALNVVHLKGLVKTGTSTIFTLPVGYRPIRRQIHAVVSNGLVGRVNVDPNGDILPSTPYSSTWVALDGITFKAEQ